MIKDAEEYCRFKYTSREKKDVLAAIVRTATDAARSSLTDGLSKARNVPSNVFNRATGDNSASTLGTAKDKRPTNVFETAMGRTNWINYVFVKTIGRRPTTALIGLRPSTTITPLVSIPYVQASSARILERPWPL